MPGKVIAVHVAAGARVTKGAPLLVMEAMKMEHTIVAPDYGTIEAVLYGAGEQVAEGAALVTFAAADA
jgi:3-methylcrotonyl-CoA carboxylase alpha subunit